MSQLSTWMGDHLEIAIWSCSVTVNELAQKTIMCKFDSYKVLHISDLVLN